jgi:tRNA(fMet)-specific endonuclease VapC
VSRGYLLDTNIVSLALRGRSASIVSRLQAQPRAKVAVSVITEMELRFGLAKHPDSSRLKGAVDAFLEVVRVDALPHNIAAVYGSLRTDLERRGRPIGALDTIIAAHAVAVGAVLVTNNGREFGRVAGLRVEDWSNA